MPERKLNLWQEAFPNIFRENMGNFSEIKRYLTKTTPQSMYTQWLFHLRGALARRKHRQESMISLPKRLEDELSLRSSDPSNCQFKLLNFLSFRRYKGNHKTLLGTSQVPQQASYNPCVLSQGRIEICENSYPLFQGERHSQPI